MLLRLLVGADENDLLRVWLNTQAAGAAGAAGAAPADSRQLRICTPVPRTRSLAGWLAGWLAYRRMAVRNPLGAPMAGAVTVEGFQQPAHVLVEVKAEVWLQPSPLVELQKLKYTCGANRRHNIKINTA